jgi:tRNA pseudouridine55 synthase
MTSGVLVLDKPRGPTSHDVVMRVRRALGVQRVGHAGTLDPMATGVLVVAVGEATKLVPWLTGQDKTYDAAIALGIETDTLDADGRETRRVPLSDDLRLALSTSRGSSSPAGGGAPKMSVAPTLQAALDAESGRIAQLPPAFSAVRQNGQRAYAQARRGVDPLLAARDVHIRQIRLTACSDDPALIAVTLDVSKGYYVRALARDLCATLGTVGHLTSLRRTRSGCFGCDEALPPDTPPDGLLAGMISLSRAAARALPVAMLSDAGARDARHGRPVRSSDIAAAVNGPSAWLDARGNLIAVGRVEETGCGCVLRGFAEV